MAKQANIYIVGHCGLVGFAVPRALKKQDYTNFLSRTQVAYELVDRPTAAEKALGAIERHPLQSLNNTSRTCRVRRTNYARKIIRWKRGPQGNRVIVEQLLRSR